MPFFAMTSCRFWRPIRVLITFLLIGYFVSKIIDSSRKLQKGEIGVSFERIREELVEGSSLCYSSSLDPTGGFRVTVMSYTSLFSWLGGPILMPFEWVKEDTQVLRKTVVDLF